MFIISKITKPSHDGVFHRGWVLSCTLIGSADTQSGQQSKVESVRFACLRNSRLLNNVYATKVEIMTLLKSERNHHQIHSMHFGRKLDKILKRKDRVEVPLSIKCYKRVLNLGLLI